MARSRSGATAATSEVDQPEVAERVEGFIDKFSPDHQALIRDARRVLRARFPTAYELAYDNYNFFVLGYGPTSRPSECIVSLTAAANGIGLCFLRGAELPDPHGILQGKGKQTRFIRVGSVEELGRPEVRELFDAAVEHSGIPWRTKGAVELVLRSVSAKQRPRRGS